MSQSPPSRAGPSNVTTSRTDATLLRQFVMEYLQQHGFDKALTMFQQGIADLGDGGDGDDGEEPIPMVGAGPSGATGREAIFRAPGPVALESTLKRNIPQAQTVSSSVLSERITPEFEAQARYIIDMLVKKSELADGENDAPEPQGKGQSLLDPSDRVRGYERYRRWVDNGLEMWKPELDALSFPIFAHTFLDLMSYGFHKTARTFFDRYHGHHREDHPQEIASLAGVTSRFHLTTNPLCQQLRSERYTVILSRNTRDLLLQWLSGAGLDEEWESGLHTSAGRQKDAVKAIINDHVSLAVINTATALDRTKIVTSNGLLPSTLPNHRSLDSFNSSTQLKLGPAPKTDRLKEQITRTLQDEADVPNGHADGPSKLANGHVNGDVDDEMNGVSTTEAAKPPPVEIKIEPDVDPDLTSPTEAETNPPIPPVFRIGDLKREVEAIRDRRKMIRLGPAAIDGTDSMSAVLPSVVAFTVFDNNEGVSSVEFSQDSSLMAVGSPESSVRLWSLKGDALKGKSIDPLDGSLVEDDGLPMRKLIGHSGPVYSLSFDPMYGSASPPQSLLSSSQDGTVRLWSLDTYSNLVMYRVHNRDPVWDVQWGPMGVYFATASRDRTARLWSSDRITPLRMYTGHLSDVNCVKFHPNSLYLASGSNDNSCRLWDVQRGACVRLFLGHSDAVTTIALSSDGRTLASAGLDCNIWLWDLGSSRPIKRMTGHQSPITSLSFSAESSVLVSGSLDSTVRCWDVKSAGGERTKSTMELDSGGLEGRKAGELPMGGPSLPKLPEVESTADLLATFHTKRTPILKTHYTPRNLCMVAGAFVPPSTGVNTGLAATKGTDS